MSKLSEPLKALINAAHAKPNTTPAPKHIRSVYERIANNAASKKVGFPAWLTASVSTTRLTARVVLIESLDCRHFYDEFARLVIGTLQLSDFAATQERREAWRLCSRAYARNWTEMHRSKWSECFAFLSHTSFTNAT